MIYTSNYARQGQNPKAISISKKPPDYFSGEHLESLAPTWDMIQRIKTGAGDQVEYTRRYLQLLKDRNIDPQTVADLPDGTILLCYESPQDFCHRHLLAQWVENHTGVTIPEWKNEKEQQKADQDALVDSLFEL